MVRWLPSLRELLRRHEARQAEGNDAPMLNLIVLEGHDAGLSFTVDGDRVAIGRGRRAPGEPKRPDRIYLRDASVSSSQAFVCRDAEGNRIEADPNATNATLVNGQPVGRASISPGDQIRMGRVLIEVREQVGPGLTGLFEAREELGRTPADRSRATRPMADTESTAEVTQQVDSRELDRTETRPIAGAGSHLVLVSGIEGWEGKSFWLEPEAPNLLGRHPTCLVSLPESGVSRQHAQVVFEHGRWSVVHLSRVNPTYVNGRPIRDRKVLADGDEIQLADRVVLRAAIEAPGAEAQSRPVASLHERMEEKLRWEQELRDEFSVHGGFLDVDVVDSYGLKSPGSPPEAQVVSFERFRAFVGAVVEEHQGIVLNSNGDELMCFFEETLMAARGASALLERLDHWNRRENVLSVPFRVRCGLHAGDCLLDRQRGVAYSEVLDVAGHLQKAADANGLMISADALRDIPSGLPFESAGKVGKNAIAAYRLVAPLAGGDD
ncbi:MAG: FHA domain-containing protein [Myxococcota bacterium]